jgi:hypothetical protein
VCVLDQKQALWPQTESSCSQPLGQDLRAIVEDTVVQLNLSTPIGNAPRDYFLARSLPGAPDSIFTMLMETVLPAVVKDAKVDDGRPRLFLANSGSQRYDIVGTSVCD